MPARLAFTILVLQCCELCVTIKVPVVWDSDNSEVINNDDDQFSIEQFKPQELQKPIPIQYFEYTAKKPQFAVDIAAFHGVHEPDNHYKARPVRPFTGKTKPELGKHGIQDPNRHVFHNFQKYINKDEPYSHVDPVSTDYNVFHPYKAEEPALQGLYKDPTLDKIRNDIRDSSQRLQTYENDAGKPDITKEEYLESLDQTDFKKSPQKNIPAPYEIHRPQRRPVYYNLPPHHFHRDNVLNQRFKHPWNQNYVKIRPVHYGPLKNHLQRLRQHHALRYGDEQNEYPQIPLAEPYEQPSDGYDIFERGKEKYVKLRNNLDESVNNLVTKYHPIVSEKLELQSKEKLDEDIDEEFVPVKNYAQVRKTETTRHLPKEAAYDDAESYEEIKNAPRLREAIKSTKAQTVYTEEGYEDSAYDHAGEQKHASDHEGHGGFLREKELSGGKYKAPSVSTAYADGSGTAYKDQIIDAKKWINNNKDNEQEEEAEDYSENEGEYSKEVENFSDGPLKKADTQRNKRQEGSESEKLQSNDDEFEEGENYEDYVSENHNDTEVDHISENKTDSKSYLENKKIKSLLKHPNGSMTDEAKVSLHDVNKREIKFKVPGININSTFLNEKDILEIAKEKIIQKADLKDKYPYYFKSLDTINEDSPLRYAEDLKLIPKKSDGGTEFYDSRSQFECPEVDDKVDALPEKFKRDGHPDENEDGSVRENNNKGENNEEKPRLQGLGDKIDCFKAKYFGENPLDSPFFKEDIISNPEPVTVPNSPLFRLKDTKTVSLLESASDNIVAQTKILSNDTVGDLHTLLEKLKNKQIDLKKSLDSEHQKLLEKYKLPSIIPENETLNNDLNANSNVLQSLKSKLEAPIVSERFSNISENLLHNNQNNSQTAQDNTYKYFLNKEDITKAPILLRRKRATPFIYEPYKIIRDVQTSDSKKTTTTTGNVSPLIKQLQTSKVIDIVKSNNEKEQPVKRNVRIKSYKDIGKKDRELKSDSSSSTFVDVSIDKRRGEPRYELRPSNHKAKYTPVENKKSMSMKDYEIYTKNLSKENNNDNKRPSPRTLFNLANNFQKSEELQNLVTASSARKSITTAPILAVKEKPLQNNESEEDYEEDYDEDDESEEDEDVSTTSTTTTTTTTTTPKPVFRRRIRSTTLKPTTTEKFSEAITEEAPKLRLVTRFRNTSARGNLKESPKTIEKNSKKYEETTNRDLPKYREKKKKSSKSTIVTDTKRYGDDDDDMKKEEIDALIGVKQDMKDYMPQYEQETKQNSNVNNNDSSEEEENSDESYEDDEEEDDEEEIEDEDTEEIEPEKEHNSSTKPPPRRSLVRTTDAPQSTTEARSAKIQAKPIISRKKYEVHKESPVNKSAPHVTEFKQDIEEVEIIKEIPRKAQDTTKNKNLEVLDLYKDDNLASDVNKLGAVEVFKENLDLKNGPRHGGNYRYIPKEELIATTTAKPPKDTEASQSENKKLIELEQSKKPVRMHGGNLKSISETKRSSGSGRNAKLIELSDEKEDGARPLHGGNLKSLNERSRNRGRGKSEKLIELNDGDEDEYNDSTDQMHGGNFGSYDSMKNSRKGMHGGNYRSSKLVQSDNVNDESKKLENTKGDKKDIRSSADLLNSFAQVIPILTTTPAYILDPSKRMYYYVD